MYLHGAPTTARGGEPPMKPARVPVVYWEQALRDAHPEWSYQVMDDDILAVTVTYEDRDYLVTCAVEEAWYAAEYAFPFLAPAHRHEAVGKLLHMVNGKLLGSVFCLDYKTGQVTCTAMYLRGENRPDSAWLKRILESLLGDVVDYEPYVVAAACYGFDITDI